MKSLRLRDGIRFALSLIAFGILASIPASASLSFCSTPGCVSANDSIVWSQLGGDSTAVANNTSVISGGGDNGLIAFGTSPNDGEVVDVGTSWTPVPPTGFSSGDALLWAFDNGTGAGTGPITLTLTSAVNGAGLWIQGDLPIPVGGGSCANCTFTAQIAFYNGASLLGTYSVTSDPAGDPVFVGAINSPLTPIINELVISLTSCGQCNGSTGDVNDFAVDALLLNANTAGTPEPSALLLTAGGLAACAWRIRKQNRKQI
jgi:hypothetical protein